MVQYDNIAIIGVGLIGGSLGKAVRQRRLAKQVVGVGRSTETLEMALRVGAIDRATTDLAEGVAEADLVIVCTPVHTIAAIVQQVAAANKKNPLITDGGSTKANITEALASFLTGISTEVSTESSNNTEGVENVESDKLESGKLENDKLCSNEIQNREQNKRPDLAARFVGSHPLAGGHHSGPEYADEDLLVEKIVVVTPTAQTTEGDVAEVECFWQALGAKTVRMSPREHDATMAATSHLPHLAATALVNATPEIYFPYTASGYRDTSRVAAGAPEMWKQIFAANQQELVLAIERLQETLGKYHEALTNQDNETLLTLLEEAKRNRDALGS